MSRIERVLLDLSIAASFGSGIVYLVMRDFMKRSDPFSVLGHPWQPHMLAAHLIAGPLVVFALGLIVRDHILGRYRAGRPAPGQVSGLVAVILAAPMILTGYLLQIVSSAAAHRVLALAHLATGALFAVLYAAHLLTAGRRRAADVVPGAAGQPSSPC